MVHHAARPRLVLVVDNSSSSLKSTPCSRAKRNNGMCSRDGMPRSGQFRIVDSDRSSSAPISSKPPNRIIKSVVVAIPNRLSHYGMFCNLKVGLFRDGPSCSNVMPFRCDYGKMGIMPIKPTKEDREFGGRIRTARKALSILKAGPFAESIGINPQTYRAYERGDRRPSQKQLEKLVEAGMSLYWVYLEWHPILILNQKKETA